MQHEYSKWRHGGWYVHTVRYPNGAIGCVSNNYPDKKWRIACDDRRNVDFTFPTREAAANAELELVRVMRLNAAADDMLATLRRFEKMAACWTEPEVERVTMLNTLETIQWEAQAAIAKATGEERT